MEEKTKVASMSVISNSFLTVSKMVIGVSSGSVSILSEGIHSGIDLFAAIIAFFAVRESGKPADAKHAYGHGKIENVSGTVEALLIFVAATWIMIEAFHKLTTGSQVESLGWGLVIMGLSAGLNLFVSTMLMRVAKKTDSVALEADALHLRTDVYTSAGVFIGLLLIYLTGWSMFDPLVAIVVAVLIIRAAIRLTQEAFLPLVDASLPAEETEIIASIINKHGHEFVEFHKLRTRKAGAERHIDLHLVVPKDTSVAQVHDLCNRIENEIKGELHEAHVLIHSEPCTDRMTSCAECQETERKCNHKKGQG
ncbi:cation diffusion facilitator family transporter [Paradesulfitobacterium ferrireducens]|uniref:cation diffusion facilitator family transporter n=1 Tax=Paradesulfitobacterium ferrireducens TaxID=2816476 RepID=UPI001A8DF64F|nr:cation diffusion facilitator family transporter [Paradesulfitobacterium ferrireducens]